MGDHEIGGFTTTGRMDPHSFEARAHSAWVSTWQNVFGHRAHYRVRLRGSVELWTLAPFTRIADGAVVAAIGPDQLRWLRRTLDASTARWKIVQSELPPYSSPGFHGWHTSQTHLHNARQLYRLLAHHGADLMLCAEFHAVDALQKLGLPEIIHGGTLASGRVNYLRIAVYRDELKLTLLKMASGTVDHTQTLWSPSRRSRPPRHITMTRGVSVAGHMTVTHDGATSSRGELRLR
jgi:hypothetical protein